MTLEQDIMTGEDDEKSTARYSSAHCVQIDGKLVYNSYYTLGRGKTTVFMSFDEAWRLHSQMSIMMWNNVGLPREEYASGVDSEGRSVLANVHKENNLHHLVSARLWRR